jgi:Ser/Thr protein kinase RdoA (MazF antagonist)
MQSSHDIPAVVSAWHIGPVRSVERMRLGANNDSWRVDTADGAFILRVYRNATARENIEFEHQLLSELAGTSKLSFAVPLPIATTDGEIVVDIGDCPATLTHFISGRHPRRGDVHETQLAGTALAELHSIMSALRLARRSGLPGYGDLRRVHPAIRDPFDLEELFAFEGERLEWYRRLVEVSESVYPHLYDTLPTQIIHSDFVPANVLLDDDRVSGVLDFEFASSDLRVMDFAVGLEYFCLRDWPDANWELLDGFADGYLARVQLTRGEIEALPAALLRRKLITMLHWAGRWRIGLATDRDIAERLEGAVRRTAWLDAYGAQLVNRLSART